MTTDLYRDVERPVRDWLRSVNLDDVGTRVYVGLPGDATLPAIEVGLVDGGVQPGEAPYTSTLFQFSIWGTKDQRTTIAGIAWALVSLLQSTDYADLTTLKLFSAVIVTGPVPRYDPDGSPRYVIDAALTLRIA